MSLNVSPPPQTYSRLFRPWDEESSSSGSECSETNELKNNKIKVEVIKNEVPQYKPRVQPAHGYGLEVPSLSPCYNPIPMIPRQVMDVNMEMALQARLQNEFMGSRLATMEQYAMTQNVMEQEYARIMAEEAQAKMVNARKQRPKKFKCSHCDVSFSNNGQLKGHVRIHTGERPFKCEEPKCGKSFTRNEELTRHKRIHTGLRPYPCATCGKCFGRRDHLKKHTKTHLPQENRLYAQAVYVPYFHPYVCGY